VQTRNASAEMIRRAHMARNNQLMSECCILCLKSALRLDGEAKRVRRRQNRAIIAADLRRFDHVINTDEVFGTHRLVCGLLLL